MQTVTIACPSPGVEAYFSFKEPVARSVQNRLGTNANKIKLKVSAVNEIKELLQSELRDPFLEAYSPSGISNAQYNQDLNDNIFILTFKFTDSSNNVKYIRIPQTFVAEMSDVAEFSYINKTMVLDFGPQHSDLDMAVWHDDFRDFVRDRTGLDVSIREVSIGEPIVIGSEEHTSRELIRANSTVVNKTLLMENAELRQLYDGVLNRLSDLNISLG